MSESKTKIEGVIMSVHSPNLLVFKCNQTNAILTLKLLHDMSYKEYANASLTHFTKPAPATVLVGDQNPTTHVYENSEIEKVQWHRLTVQERRRWF
jgi:hypothetical protein